MALNIMMLWLEPWYKGICGLRIIFCSFNISSPALILLLEIPLPSRITWLRLRLGVAQKT